MNRGHGHVVVVGGGLSGIAAALDCARGGAGVTLIESRGRLGGAAYSFTRHGIRADNGQHVFLRCCTAYRRLLDEIGAGSLVTLQPRLDLPVMAPDGRHGRLGRSALPAPLHLAPALAAYPFLSWRERLSLARAMQALGRIDVEDPAADASSFGDWLRARGQGEAAIEAIWSLIARPTLNLRVHDASLAQAAYVFQEGLLRSPSAGDIGYASVPLSDIHDVAARRALAAAGVRVGLRRGATAITQTASGTFCVEVSGAPTIEADAVVLAVPPERARRLLPPGTGVDAGGLERLGSSPIVNLHVVYDRRVFEHPFAAGIHTPVQWMFDRTASAGLDAGQYLAVTLSAADDELEMTAEELRDAYLPALAELLPAARDATVTEFFVTREHAATFRAAPGARSLRPGPVTRRRGFVLAGTWTDTGWPATMEGAVRSGHAAAAAALEALPARGQRRATPTLEPV